MKSPEFGTVKDGEWHITPMTGLRHKFGHFHKCCGCGLVHKVKYRLYEVHPQGYRKGIRRLNIRKFVIGVAYWRQDKEAA